PAAGIPIVRGWYRQDDFPQNELLYDQTLGPKTYLDWLRNLGVRYVVLSDATPDYSARAEANLVRSGRAHLLPVYRSRHLRIFRVPGAKPIVTGPAPSSVSWLWPSRLAFVGAGPGPGRVARRRSAYR